MTAVVSIGSNLGDRLAALQLAVDVLDATAVSPVYETAPVGGPEQPPYLNAVLVSPHDAAAAWELAQAAEQAMGRTRDIRWGPRTLDVDLILAQGAVPPELQLPHPRAHERAFVLAPWLDVDAGAVLPGRGPVRILLASLDRQGVHKRDHMRLVVAGPVPHSTKES